MHFSYKIKNKLTGTGGGKDSGKEDHNTAHDLHGGDHDGRSNQTNSSMDDFQKCRELDNNQSISKTREKDRLHSNLEFAHLVGMVEIRHGGHEDLCPAGAAQCVVSNEINLTWLETHGDIVEK